MVWFQKELNTMVSTPSRKTNPSNVPLNKLLILLDICVYLMAHWWVWASSEQKVKQDTLYMCYNV